jgi:hypothetical protein
MQIDHMPTPDTPDFYTLHVTSHSSTGTFITTQSRPSPLPNPHLHPQLECGHQDDQLGPLQVSREEQGGVVQSGKGRQQEGEGLSTACGRGDDGVAARQDGGGGALLHICRNNRGGGVGPLCCKGLAGTIFTV